MAASTRDAPVDHLVNLGSALLAQRPPVPKIREPGPRNQVEMPLRLAQAADPRVMQLEEQIRQLNGLVEELNFQVLQMQDQLRRMQEDNEFRFQEIEKRVGVGGGGEATTMEKTDNTQVEEIIEDGSTETASTTTGEPPRNLGNITFDKDGNVLRSETADSGLPGVETGRIATDNTQVAALPSTSDPDELYRTAYEFVLSGDYQTAEAGFREHIDRFPQDARAADAHFWLGEALLGQEKYRDAAQVFLGASRDYPQARKAPEMMLKLGVSLAALDQRDVACATLAEVAKRYPQASTAVLERTKVEQARASC
ncbi:MAG: tol-pal system protein YbgF [Rhizobiaceae bacterium]|nr:tol-pal system protein YbgF [Rhizobiaceae bacterium]